MITIQSLFLTLALGAATSPLENEPTRFPVRVVQRFDSEWVLKANSILQQDRLKGRVLEDVAVELAGSGPSAIQAYFAILAGTVDGPTQEGERRPSANSLDPNAVLLAALARMNPKDVAAHVAVAASGDASLDVRIVALRVLEQVGAEGGLDAWINIVADVPTEHFSRAYVQGPLERSLAAVVSRDTSALVGLKARLAQFPPALVPLVLRGLSTSRRPQAMPVLTGLLGSNQAWDLVLLPCVGKLAETVLGDLSEEELTWVRPFAMDDDWRVRREALILLGRVGDWRSHALLTSALRDENRLVQQAAQWSLVRMSKNDLGDDVEAWDSWFEREIAWFEERGSRASEAIENGDPARLVEGMREWTLHGLFRHDAARAVATALTRTDSGVVAQACSVLRELKSPTACPALLEALKTEDASIREAARATLAEITGLALSPDAESWRRALLGT